MKRIVAETQTGFINIPGDRMEYNEPNNMIFGYDGDRMVLAIELAGVMKIHLSEKEGRCDG